MIETLCDECREWIDLPGTLEQDLEFCEEHDSCFRCQRDFGSASALLQHKRDSPAHFYCSRCEREFVSAAARNQHERDSRAHNICNYCEIDYTHPAGLHSHSEAEHWPCTECDDVLETREELTEHFTSDHNYCEDCERHFSSANNLRAHRRSAKHAGRTIRCPGCQSMYPTISAMVIHLESGTCPSGITRQKVNEFIRDLDTNHLITNRLIEGPNCGQGAQVETLATRDAWNGRSFECYFCHRGFGLLVSLNQHLKSPAHDSKIYRCAHCRVDFGLLSGLVQHVESESCGISRFKETRKAIDQVTSRLTKSIAY